MNTVWSKIFNFVREFEVWTWWCVLCVISISSSMLGVFLIAIIELYTDGASNLDVWMLTSMIVFSVSGTVFLSSAIIRALME